MSHGHDEHSSNSYPLDSWQSGGSQRGRDAYQVASGSSYMPDYRDRSVSPNPSAYQPYRSQTDTSHTLPVPPPHGSASDMPAAAAASSSSYRDVSPSGDMSHAGYGPPSPYSFDSEHLQAPGGTSPTSRHFKGLSSSSYAGLAATAARPGSAQRPLSYSSLDDYRPSSRGTDHDSYPHQARGGPAPFGTIDPNEILDDGDDGWGLPPSKKRNAASGAGAGLGGLASLTGSKNARDLSGSYKPVGMSMAGAGAEKTQWLQDEARRRRRRKWLALVVVGIIVLIAIVGGIVGAVITTRKSNDADNSSAEDTGPDLTKDSASIKALMGNKNFHKVFPGMDYTPINTQYPDCLHNPPSQNNVTKDVAILSQLTPELRLYGNDCNQTEMVLHAIDVLGLGTDLKIWLGVWQDGNSSTNARQLRQLYDILDKDDHLDAVSGVVVGNEVLFSKYMTETELIGVIDNVRANLTSRGLQLPVATSDLGSNWSKTLADAVDVVMANVHPFFGGVPVPEAAGWTWQFWQTNDVSLTGTDKKHTISEVGWPSAGGNDCGDGVTCPDDTSGSVAGIDEMNTFMDTWICQSLTNSTSYFWFEAFDEPWKIRFNQPGKEWEDKWGLMDVNRNLKKGLSIPDCGGTTASAPAWPTPMAVSSSGSGSGSTDASTP